MLSVEGIREELGEGLRRVQCRQSGRCPRSFWRRPFRACGSCVSALVSTCSLCYRPAPGRPRAHNPLEQASHQGDVSRDKSRHSGRGNIYVTFPRGNEGNVLSACPCDAESYSDSHRSTLRALISQCLSTMPMLLVILLELVISFMLRKGGNSLVSGSCCLYRTEFIPQI